MSSIATTLKRSLAQAASVALLLALAGTGAAAHVALETPEAKVGAAYKAVFKVPHGCEGSPTVEVRIDIPEGVIGVKPMPKPGWSLALQRGPYARSYAFYHGAQLGEGVRQVTWTGGPLPDEYFDEFVLNGFIAAELPPAPIYFPVTQRCATGELRWSEIPAAGQDPHALKFPAPQLRLVAGDAGAHAATAAGLVIEGPWARPTPPGMTVSAGYLEITNTGSAPDVLLGASSPIAAGIELHETTVSADGVSSMRPLTEGLAIAPGATAELKPGGTHFMLMGLREPLKEGQTFRVTLNFKAAGAVEAVFTVKASGAPAHVH